MTFFYKKTFKSQLEYGRYGANICTPVSSIFAYEFLLRCKCDMKSQFFSGIRDMLEEIMTSSHTYYGLHCAHTRKNLMISDLFALFPENLFYVEIAGNVRESDASASVKLECVDNRLWLGSQEFILQKILKNSVHPVVVVITRMEHTVAYLFDSSSEPRNSFYFFDPIEASFLHCSASANSKNNNPWFLEGSEYSGVIMMMEGASSPADFLHYVQRKLLDVEDAH